MGFSQFLKSNNKLGELKKEAGRGFRIGEHLKNASRAIQLGQDVGKVMAVAALLVALESERLPARHIFVEMILVAAANVMQPKFNNWRYAGAGPDDGGGKELSRLQVHHTSFTRYTLED